MLCFDENTQRAINHFYLVLNLKMTRNDNEASESRRLALSKVCTAEAESLEK